MPRMVITWESAGSLEQDDALSDEIMDAVMAWLDAYSPDVSVDLGASEFNEGQDA